MITFLKALIFWQTVCIYFNFKTVLIIDLLFAANQIVTLIQVNILDTCNFDKK